MESWRKLEILREYIDDSRILDELSQYMSSDELDAFMEHCADAFETSFEFDNEEEEEKDE